MRVKGIAQKWLLNSFGIVLVILIIFIIGIGVLLREYYYGAVQQLLLARSDFVYSMLERYAQGSATGSVDGDLRDYVVSYADKETIELMALDPSGVTKLTSSGFTYQSGAAPDYQEALDSDSGIGWWTGEMNGQKVMAVCRLVPVLNSSYSAFRFVVSLEMVDRIIMSLILLVTGLGFVVLTGVYLVGIAFAKSLVRPIRELGAAAIAHITSCILRALYRKDPGHDTTDDHAGAGEYARIKLSLCEVHQEPLQLFRN